MYITNQRASLLASVHELSCEILLGQKSREWQSFCDNTSGEPSATAPGKAATPTLLSHRRRECREPEKMGRCVGATTDGQGAIALYLVFFLVAAFQVCMGQHTGHASNQINITNNKKKVLLLTEKRGAGGWASIRSSCSRVRNRF